MGTVQVASTTPDSLKTISLKQLLVWGWWIEHTFLGKGRRWGASNCQGPAHRSTNGHILSMVPADRDGVKGQILEQQMLLVLLTLSKLQGFQELCGRNWGQGLIYMFSITSQYLYGLSTQHTCELCRLEPIVTILQMKRADSVLMWSTTICVFLSRALLEHCLHAVVTGHLHHSKNALQKFYSEQVTMREAKKYKTSCCPLSCLPVSTWLVSFFWCQASNVKSLLEICFLKKK